jgi:hypothetical protein
MLPNQFLHLGSDGGIRQGGLMRGEDVSECWSMKSRDSLTIISSVRHGLIQSLMQSDDLLRYLIGGDCPVRDANPLCIDYQSRPNRHARGNWYAVVA